MLYLPTSGKTIVRALKLVLARCTTQMSDIISSAIYRFNHLGHLWCKVLSLSFCRSLVKASHSCRYTMDIGGITFPELDTFEITIRRVMATRGQKTLSIRYVGQIAFRIYARRVYEFRGLDTFEILTLGWIDGKLIVRCSRNAIFCACKISRSFADHPSTILISKVDKFYTGLTMIIQKKRHVRTLSQNLIHFTIRCHREKHSSASIKYRRFQKNI